MADGAYDYLFKIVLIGDSNVGKTSILTRFSDDSFSESFIATIGVDFRVRTLEVDAKLVKLQIWDTAGQERFRTITSAYYRGADGIVIVYDVTCQESFDHVETWLGEIARYTTVDSVSKLVIGNKSDLEDKRAVDPKVAEAFCEGRGIPWLEGSAKTNEKVDEAFQMMVSEILKRRAKDAALIRDVQQTSGFVMAPQPAGCCGCLPMPSFLRRDKNLAFANLESDQEANARL
mmetsp:Transcript_47446/g.111670  ORF Transcript_47446/g.111670 Transcript_47446/m.111670 type:complete len:232 (-) Transcript_47446:73-768(-)|eukprot:CAMPEP_0175919782 /NCGR_PEP_ID=MMETSP0108-20121206/12575_1 /TAXON_ID=195067 ORGANISM="Goniomonas pacifica, Strain CCMP1869" /NCGR_SAMPLE_ID=MMETSP0108 /ASSEMBLY_ACC=CAM_ASM_000204 /LENGTH=231 /DNA_ID=CAMNT_0017242447 /DNA_START=52 /DNA_END=747 /DNA_ORIENTATION=+